MNDVKLPVTPQTASPKGAGGQGGVASSEPQPSTSRRTANDTSQATVKDNEASALSAQTESAVVNQAGPKVDPKEDKEQQQNEVQEAVAKLNDYIQSVQRDLEFNLDDDSGRVVVTVVDRNTNETIRQIPDEMALKLARNLQSEEPISLLNTKA